ncbi:ATP-binding protein [Leptospira ellinghausenii]|nr:ATP-binding protein [Leptospira ellinghausenii]
MTTMRQKQIRFIGYLSGIFITLAIINSFAMLLFFGNTFFSFFGFFVALLFYITYTLNKKGFHFLSKNLILLLFNFAIINISSTQGKGSGSILLYFPLLSLYFLVFETIQWRWIVYWTLVSLLSYFYLETSEYSILKFGDMAKIDLNTLFQFNLFLSFLGEFLIMLMFIRVNHELENSYVVKAEELNDSLKELSVAKEKAEKAAQSRSMFLSSMSHEIRTPINSIIGFTNILLDDDPKEEHKDFLSMIQFSSRNLLVIINDILDFNKMEAGKVELEFIPFDFQSLIHKIFHSMKVKADEKNLSFKLEIDEGISEFLIGDPNRLTQILINLISNAIKFTLDGEIGLVVKLEDTLNDTEIIRFIVRDTGIGIPEKNQKIIFDHFSQADSSTSRKFGGTGLGLSIVKKLVELYGSNITLESKEGEGSEFSFLLEFAKSELIPEEKRFVIQKKSSNQRKNKTILVVDDNELNLKVAFQFIRKCGFECLLASNGKEALQIVSKEKISLVLMDLQMPDWDGFVTTEKIRASGIFTPIIALTADVSIDVSNHVKRSGFLDIIHKPFLPEDLVNKIELYAE